MSGIDDDELLDLLGPDPEPAAPKRPGVHTSPAAVKHAGGREIFLRAKSQGTIVAGLGKKNSPERLKRLVTYMSEIPNASAACQRAGISFSSLKYWLQKSSEGAPGDGFDMVFGEGDDAEWIRFHDAWENAKKLGCGRLEVAAYNKAIGQPEPQVFQGRVIYKTDPDLLDLGLSGHLAYLKDEFGAPIPETVIKQDPDLMMALLKAYDPDKFGNKQQIDVNHRGGVLVVGAVVKTPQDLNLLESEYKRLDRPPVLFEDEEDNT